MNAEFEQPLTTQTSLFCQGGIFSSPVTYPTWWFASLTCVIALQKLSGFPFSKIGALLRSLTK